LHHEAVAMVKSKDLFDDTSMTFGEHLEALRTHMIRAVIGLGVAMAITLPCGGILVRFMESPITQALARNALVEENDVSGFNFWSYVQSWFGKTDPANSVVEKKPIPEKPADAATIVVQIKPSELTRFLHAADPKRYPAVAASLNEEALSLPITAPEFREFRRTTEEMHRPVTLNVQEAFLIYIKVALVSGLVLASPWIIYQLWLFVAAGLYPHERRYVHVYLPMSLGLFLFGSCFCFYLALPLVLDFLLSYNRWLDLVPQLRISEWMNFVLLLPLTFGISFQLPLIMLFLDRIRIFKAEDYRQRRRLAIFIIAIAATLLSPGQDPGTMMLMFIPLVILYEFGILLCKFRPAKQSMEELAAG
jgi:sec-independent protein translocase protein TatC